MISKEKIKEWVSLFLAHIQEEGAENHVREAEGYKFKSVDIFQRNFDIDAPDLAEMLDVSVVNNNLVASSWYFPRKMLLIFADESPKETRKILRVLFDEKLPVKERINRAEEDFHNLMNARNKRLKKNSHSFIKLRFLSLLLSYRYPEKHNALKPREWKSFFRFIDLDFNSPRGISSGVQYELFLPYIEELRKFITTLPKIQRLKRHLTEGLIFQDDSFRWITQDVIYVTARILEKVRSEKEDASQEGERQSEIEELENEEKIPATIGNRFYYEEDLENFIVDNLEKLDLGQKLKLYTDEAGATGRQYHTDSGYIDILALDKSGNFVVIELKRDRATVDFIGQIAKYMLWVDDHLAKKLGKKVSGIIVAYRGDRALVNAIRALKFPVSIKHYQLNLLLKDSEEK